MLLRTHLLITLCFALLFMPFVAYPFLFLGIALVATYIPDIDLKYPVGKKRFFLRPLQWMVSHRGFLHSFVFMLLITLGFVLFFPFVALPFFLGYASHLMADSFTVKGIRPFYPFSYSCLGRIKTGGISETNVLIFFILADLFLILSRVF